MKTSDRLATILFLLAAPAARFLELKNNYDPAGLPTGGFPYLPAVLAAAAVVFLLSARGLPARDAVTADFGKEVAAAPAEQRDERKPEPHIELSNSFISVSILRSKNGQSPAGVCAGNDGW